MSRLMLAPAPVAKAAPELATVPVALAGARSAAASAALPRRRVAERCGCGGVETGGRSDGDDERDDEGDTR